MNTTTITFDDIARYIRSSTQEQRDDLVRLIQNVNSLDTWQRTRRLKLGSAVEFTSKRKRTPFTYQGQVTSLGRSRAHVKITSCNSAWPKYPVGSTVVVPFGMLVVK